MHIFKKKLRNKIEWKRKEKKKETKTEKRRKNRELGLPDRTIPSTRVCDAR
jgi:hypothetical protein